MFSKALLNRQNILLNQIKLLIFKYFHPSKYKFHTIQVNISQNKEKTKQENLPYDQSQTHTKGCYTRKWRHYLISNKSKFADTIIVDQ